MRDLISNPYRPVALDPAWLHWKGIPCGSLPRRFMTSVLLSGCPWSLTPWKKPVAPTPPFSTTAASQVYTSVAVGPDLLLGKQ